MMKITLVLLAIFFVARFTSATTTTDPKQYEFANYYTTGDTKKLFKVDINNDGAPDWFFITVPFSPDPVDVQTDVQNGGAIDCSLYVSVPGTNTYTVCMSMDINGTLLQGVGVLLNPDEMYVGKISEINRFGIVVNERVRSKSIDSYNVIAYTWEADHLKQWKLATYLAGQDNIVYNKYLGPGKRTEVQIQAVSQ